MRIDDFLSTVGVIKRRTIAKELAKNGMVEVNGRTIKAAYEVNTGDIILIKGNRRTVVEVRAIPTGSVPKTARDEYVRELPAEP